MSDNSVLDMGQIPVPVATLETGTGAQPVAVSAPAIPAGVSEDAVVLTLNDLLPDPHGDIVLHDQSGTIEMAVVTDKRVVDTGVADHHTTADGTDVAGMTYYSFESGPTLYVPADMQFSVVGGPIG